MDKVYERQVPKKLEELVNSGLAEIAGCLIRKTDTKKIIGHLEAVAKNSDKVSLLDIIQGLKTINISKKVSLPPVGAINTFSSLATNIQNAKIINQNTRIINQNTNMIKTLEQIQGMLNNVHSLAWATTGLGVINLGVSLAGFKTINVKLSKMTQRLDEINSNLGNINLKLDGLTSYEIAKIVKESKNHVEMIQYRISKINETLELTENNERDINDRLINCRTFLESIIDQYISGSAICIGLDLIIPLYVAYFSLLKLYHSVYFYNYRELCNLDASKTLYKRIHSKEMLNAVYKNYILNSKEIILENQLHTIINFFEYTVNEPMKSVLSQEEIFKIITVDDYKTINRIVQDLKDNSSESYYIFIEHERIA